jgi:hypothetical protein
MSKESSTGSVLQGNIFCNLIKSGMGDVTI